MRASGTATKATRKGGFFMVDRFAVCIQQKSLSLGGSFLSRTKAPGQGYLK